jgi:hypothetical protein
MKNRKRKTLLILTSSGGGGLIQAAVAKEQEARAQDPHVNVIVKDVLKEWVWKIISRFGIFAYNWNQKSGAVFLQTLLTRCQRAAEGLFAPNIFFKTKELLFRENVDRLIDTQPLGLKAIIRALRIYHKKTGKKVLLELIVVDLPTPSCQHFFRGVRKLSEKDKEYLSCISIEPLLASGESEADFWKKQCGLKLSQVVYEKYPIRQSFKKFLNKGRSFVVKELQVRSTCEEEKLRQAKIFEKGSIRFSPSFEGHLFSIAPEDRVMVILLGTNPAENAAFRYLAEILKSVQQVGYSKNIHLFVFCGKYEGALYQDICQFLENHKNYPKNVTVIPMAFQKDDVIAPLFFRSNLLITKSGGHTAMELLGVAKGRVWIHSEAKKKPFEAWTLKKLLSGIVFWEAANAYYLREKMGAEIVTPERLSQLFEEECKKGF